MKRLLRVVGVLLALAFAGYVGSFAVLVQRGLGYGRQMGLSNAYYFADPATDPGFARHYATGRPYFPLVYVLQHWTGGPYCVYP